MTSLKIYIDEAMREARKEALEIQAEAKYYKKMRLYNLIRRAEFMEEKGEHMDESAIEIMELASGTKGLTPQSRHRMSKEIAEELLAEKGDGAHFYALEKLTNNTTAPQLWRDVLTYLDELKGEEK